jgi:hypothetical protein
MAHGLTRRSLVCFPGRGLALLVCLGAAALGGTGRNDVLAALPDNTWRRLDTAGMVKARMYSGACFGGGRLWYFGGAHRSYPGNDVELFDPFTCRWTQATEAEMPPRDSADWKAMTGGGGSTSRLSPKGRPYTEHTYQQVCWQPERKRFFVALVSSGTWEFDPAARKWHHLINRFENRAADPRGSWAQNHVLYEPALKAPVLVVGSGGSAAMYRFDHDERRWAKLGPTPGALKWNEFYSTYVPDWQCHLLSTAKGGFYWFAVPTRKITPVETPEALKRSQALSYDAVSRVVVALASRKVSRYRRTVAPWVLNVQKQQWTEMSPGSPAPTGQTTGAWGTLWYDPVHNVHLLINCVRRDREQLFDGGVTEVWAYRYKAAEPERPADPARNGGPDSVRLR